MKKPFSGGGLKALALRGTSFTVLDLVASNLLRLGSNLILTRILFPEAFGLMALVQTFVQGLKLFSDTGVIPSIVRSERGDDPDFLNTAWTIQICRGALLWVLATGFSFPLAAFYEEPMLGQLMPVAALTLLVSGLAPTNVATAKRHLTLGRLTALSLGTQAIGITITVVLAWLLDSVWALVIGGLLSAIATVALQHKILPGIRNRLHWNASAFWEIFNFGKFIFLSSALGFIMSQGDRLVLGKHMSMAEFGVYNIGYMLAMLPFMIGKSINGSVVFPLCRMRPIGESAANRAKVFRARRVTVTGALTLAGLLAFVGVPVVEFLYDPRYAMAGPVVVLMCLSLVPRSVVTSYAAVFLAAGDSRAQFILVLVGAILQITLLLVGVQIAGTFAVILVPGIVHVLLIPLRAWLLSKHGGWDPVGDLILGTYGFALTGMACWMYWDQIVLLID